MGALESSTDLTDSHSCGSFSCASSGGWTLLGCGDDMALSIAEEHNFLDRVRTPKGSKTSSESLEDLGWELAQCHFCCIL